MVGAVLGKGNQIIVVHYGIFLLVFMYIYGGMKIGYMKGSSIIYSQMMTAFCANALMYLQIILLCATCRTFCRWSA